MNDVHCTHLYIFSTVEIKSITYFSTLGCRIRIPPIDLQLAIQQNIIFKKYYKNVKNVKGKPIVKHLEDFLQKTSLPAQFSVNAFKVVVGSGSGS